MQSAQYHFLNIEIATKYNIEKSILLTNIAFFVDYNAKNENNLHDGYYWTYNSAAALQEIYPYMSRHKIDRLLREMEKDGLIKSGVYNKKKYDKTKWYTISEDWLLDLFGMKAVKSRKKPSRKNAERIPQKCGKDSAKMRKGFRKNAEPIPVVNTVVNTDVNSYSNTFSNENVNDSVTSNNLFQVTDEKPLLKNKELIHYWNNKAIALKTKNKKHPTIHNTEKQTKTLLKIDNSITELLSGTFFKSKSLSEKYKDVNKVYSQKDIKQSIDNYYLLWEYDDYSYTNYKIDKNKLSKSMSEFFYNYAAGMSYFVTVLNSTPRPPKKQALDAQNGTYNERLSDKYKTTCPALKSLDIGRNIQALEKEFEKYIELYNENWTHKKRAKKYYTDIYSVADLHIEYLKEKYDFDFDNLKAGHLNTHGKTWEGFKAFLKEKTGIDFSITDKEVIAEKRFFFEVGPHGDGKSYDYIGYYYVKDYTDSQLVDHVRKYADTINKYQLLDFCTYNRDNDKTWLKRFERIKERNKTKK